VRRNTLRFSFQYLVVIIVVVLLVGQSVVSGESGPNTPDEAGGSLRTESSLSSQKRNPTYQMWEFVRKGDSKGIQKLFHSLDDGFGKMSLASQLMELGIRDEKYFRYLAKKAQIAIERDVPFPMKFNEKGKAVRGEMSEAFLAWCEKNQVDPGEMTSILIYEDPIPVMLLAKSGDPRALPLLLRGLDSLNLYIVAKAAYGLGLIGDPRAIDHFIQAIDKAPEEVRPEIVKALGYFDHPKAQAALERFIQDPQLRQTFVSVARAEQARRKKMPAFVFGDSPIPKQ